MLNLKTSQHWISCCEDLGDGHYGNQANIPLYQAFITFKFAPLGFTFHLFWESPVLRFYFINILFIFDVHVLFTF
jgi:hypothetical protein